MVDVIIGKVITSMVIAWLQSSIVLSVQVALLACVLIGSLAKLSFSFCKKAEFASILQFVDVIIGNVITSMVFIWLQKSITIPNSFMV